MASNPLTLRIISSIVKFVKANPGVMSDQVIGMKLDESHAKKKDNWKKICTEDISDYETEHVFRCIGYGKAVEAHVVTGKRDFINELYIKVVVTKKIFEKEMTT